MALYRLAGLQVISQLYMLGRLPLHRGQHSPGSRTILEDGQCNTGQARFAQINRPALHLQVTHGSSVVVTDLSAVTTCPFTWHPVGKRINQGFHSCYDRMLINSAGGNWDHSYRASESFYRTLTLLLVTPDRVPLEVHPPSINLTRRGPRIRISF